MAFKIKGHGEKAQYFIDGQKVTKAAFEKACPPKPLDFSRGLGLSTLKPKLSDALAVHPDQIEEAEADAKKKGVPTEFHRDGRAIMRSRDHQKQYLRAYGFHNKDAGYGD